MIAHSAPRLESQRIGAGETARRRDPRRGAVLLLALCVFVTAAPWLPCTATAEEPATAPIPVDTGEDATGPVDTPDAPGTPDTPDAEAQSTGAGEPKPAVAKPVLEPVKKLFRRDQADVETAHSPYEAPSAAIQEWQRRVELIELGLETGEAGSEDVDALFGELSAELWPMQEAVHRAIHEDAVDLIERHNELAALYDLRSRLVPHLGKRLSSVLTGLNPVGRAEAARELDYFSANIEYQRHILGQSEAHVSASIEDAPVTALWQLLKVIFVILAFRWWRRWAKSALPFIRQQLITERPRRAAALRRARTIWYFERVRGPLEWLAVAWAISHIVQPAGFEEISTLVHTVIKWLFIGIGAVRLLDARATRTARRRTGDTARLRMRSLRLAGYWGILLGLALDLTNRYAGTGVMHAWVLRGGMVLSIPVLLLLLHWWRGPIFDRLESFEATSDQAAKLGARRDGFGSYTAAALGGLFLLREATIRVIIRLLSGAEFGRRIIAQLVRREVARDGERAGHAHEEPIADEVILPLIAARDVLIDEIAKTELDIMKASMGTHVGGSSAVIGERGAGKTIFLERLAARFDGAMLIVDCPTGGIEELLKAIAARFSIEPGEGLASRLQGAIDRQGVRAIGIDNLHRLPRPWLGGQAGLQEMARLAGDIDSSVSWVFAVDRRAWRYVMLAGGERALLHETIELPAWSEEQLASLVEARAGAIDLEPNYEKLVLPRQLDASEYDDDEKRNRLGYARILWELADGNPEVALYLFAESLRRLPDGNVILRIPQLSSPGSLVNAHPEAMLVLRALVQCDVASADDIARNLQLDPERVEQILRFCTQNGWVVTEHGGHRVSWRWFRSVTRALVRQNLMTR